MFFFLIHKICAHMDSQIHHIAGYETPYTECGQKQLCFRWSACLSSIEANIKHWDWHKNNLPNMGLIMLNTRNETCGSGSQLGDSGFIKPSSRKSSREEQVQRVHGGYGKQRTPSGLEDISVVMLMLMMMMMLTTIMNNVLQWILVDMCCSFT